MARLSSESTLADSQPRERRPKACVPCHERKVRCDASITGTPCSRCVSRNRTQNCILLPPKGSVRARARDQVRKRQDVRKTHETASSIPFHSTVTNPALPDAHVTVQHSQLPITQDITILSPHDERRTPSAHGSFQQTLSPSATVSAQLASNAQNSIETPYAVSEEDAHVQTLHRMTDGGNPITTRTGIPGEAHSHEVFEYFDRLNSISLLGEALGRRQKRRLIQLDLSSSEYTSAKQRELSTLNAADKAYLNARRVFVMPPRSACVSLIRLWFNLVYPYTPVLDRSKFYDDFAKDECSHFLLYAIFANIIPYAPVDLVLAAGYSDRNAAQRDFSQKAQLLHDFGCERRQLILLQGSCILSSFQSSYAPTKDFRFWLHNAFRIATQMGLHRNNLGDDLDPRTHSLCRRIWWTIYARDVLFNLSGFANARWIDDQEVDTTPLTLNDWPEENLPDDAIALMGPITNIYRSYSIQNCQLALLGGKFLRFARNPRVSITRSAAQEYSDEFTLWRKRLPEELSENRVTVWSSENVWIIFILAMSYRLECLFYRTAREHFRQTNDTESNTWCKQQLTSCVFELDTLTNRAIVHDLVKYMPASMIVCACNLLAFLIEIALDEESTASRRFTAKAHINALLAYFQESGDNWQIANWTYKVSDWVVKRAGLKMQVDSTPLTEISDQTQQNWGYHHEENGVSTSGGIRIPAPLAPFFSNEASLAFGDVLPDHWFQDFFGDSLYSQLDNHFVSFGQQ